MNKKYLVRMNQDLEKARLSGKFTHLEMIDYSLYLQRKYAELDAKDAKKKSVEQEAREQVVEFCMLWARRLGEVAVISIMWIAVILMFWCNIPPM